MSSKVYRRHLAVESEGLRRFLAHLLALYQHPRKSVLCFEEPEKGMHPGALAVLADYFNAAVARQKQQIILTTHSPQLLDHFPPDAIRVVKMQDGRTSIRPLATTQREAIQDHLLNAGEILTAVEPETDPADPQIAGQVGQ